MYPENHNFNPSDEIPKHSFYEVGLIAQDLLKIEELSFVVKKPSNNLNPLSVDYNSILTYSIRAIQELNVLVKTQQTTINDLSTRLVALEP